MESSETRYDRLTDAVAELYEQGRQQQALEVLKSADADLDPWAAELAHLEACLYGSLGEPAAALKSLQAASEAGGWWHEPILTEDDDLAALRDLPEFADLLAVSRQRREAAIATEGSSPALLDLPEAGEARGVVVALHGAGQRAGHARRDWAAVLGLGYALLCVESSQLMSPMYRTWPDPDLAAQDIASGVAELPAELRELPLIAAGFSAGGRVALGWALTARPVPAAGVVVLAPALRGLPAVAAGPLAPAQVLIGSDDDLLAVVEEEADRLAALGIEVLTVPGLGHRFPDDFTARLVSALPGRR